MSFFKGLVGFGLVVVGLSAIPVTAQSRCTALKVLESDLNVANKAISAPALGLTGNNWNTDFAVPTGKNFRRYVATVKTDKNGQYDLKMALKYSDGTSKVYFEQPGRPMGVDGTVTMTARPGKKKPYQVNVLTGGTTVLGNVVTIRASACT